MCVKMTSFLSICDNNLAQCIARIKLAAKNSSLVVLGNSKHSMLGLALLSVAEGG